MKTYYATIASNQNIDGIYGPGCVEIHADDYATARKLIHDATEGHWAFMYESLDDVHELDRKILGVLE